MIDYSKFLQLDYWFGTGSEFYWFWPVVSSFAILIILSLILRLVVKNVEFQDRNLKKILKELPMPLTVFGIIGLIFSFFKYEGVAFLGIRFLFLLLFLIFLVWIAYAIFKFKVLYPKIEHQYKTQEFSDKYRPKAKPTKHTFKKK